jgi:uncharacterized membrane protein YccC
MRAVFGGGKPMSRPISSALALVLLLTGVASSARAELAAWDQAKVSGLAKQLQQATHDLYDTFYKQPKVGAGQAKAYYRLKQDIRHLRSEAKGLATALEKGAGQEETLPVYEDLMQAVRRARENAGQVFSTQDVQQRATAVRQLLNQISPYYDPDAVPLQPVTR